MQTATTPAPLAERWADFQQANPKSRIRDAAAHLGSSETELLATRNTGAVDSPVVGLTGDFRELLKQMPALGRVMALTRNESVSTSAKACTRTCRSTGTWAWYWAKTLICGCL